MNGSNEDSKERYFLEADVKYLVKLHELHNDLPFLPERKKLEKIKKLVTNLHDKTKYVIQIKKIKPNIKSRITFEKVHRVIKCNQKAWPKPNIDMNTKLRQKAKKQFWERFFQVMNDAVFGKTTENVRKHRNIKLVTTDRRRDYLVSEPNYHTAKFFTENLLAL